MDKFMDRIQDFVLPISEKLSENKILQAISETLQIVMPIIVIGSFGALFAFIDIGPWQKFLESAPLLKTIFMEIHSWTLNSVALFVAMILPYRYAEKIGLKESANMIPLTAAVFIMLDQPQPYTDVGTAWLGHQGLFTALILGVVVPAFSKFLVDKDVTIKMPEGVPKFIADTFNVLIPAAIVLAFFGVLTELATKSTFENVNNFIYTLIQRPLQNVGLSFPGLVLNEVLMTILMFCGIHGGVARTPFQPLVLAAGVENMEAMSAGQPMPHIWVTGLWNTIQAGGIGATLGFGIILFLFARSKRYRTLSRVAIVPQIFNIGEPLLFGVPIVLNPLLFIPYMGGVLVNTVVVYGLIYFGVIGKFTGVEVSWTIPMVVQGILSHSNPLVGGLLQLGIVTLDALIWFPFMRIIDNQALKEEEGEEAEALPT